MKRFLLGLVALSGAVAACTPNTSADDAANGVTSPAPTALLQDRFRIFESALDHTGTVSAVYEALDRRDLSVFAVVDHAAGAQSVDMTLPPSTLIIFGSAKGGTPLIAAEPLMGAELPLRALVYEKDAQVYLAITGMGFLERTYGLESRATVVDKINDLLSGIANEATSL